jgi:hypothetical protein
VPPPSCGLTAARGQATDKTSVPKEERGLIKTTEKADAMNWSGRTARGDTSALKWLKPSRVHLH